MSIGTPRSATLFSRVTTTLPTEEVCLPMTMTDDEMIAILSEPLPVKWDFDTAKFEVMLDTKPISWNEIKTAAKIAYVTAPTFVAVSGFVQTAKIEIDEWGRSNDDDLRVLDTQAWDAWRVRYPRPETKMQTVEVDERAHLQWCVDDYLTDPVNVAHVRTVLKGAADALSVHGWCQGTLRTADGRLCTMGAALTAAKETDVDLAAVIAAANLLERAMPESLIERGMSVVGFNDSHAGSALAVSRLIDDALTLLDTY